MELFRGLEALQRVGAGASVRPRRCGRIAVVGFFDGLHVGHQRLLREVRSWAAEDGSEPVVVTFREHPQVALTGARPLQILSLDHRLLLLERSGVAATVVLDFDSELASWSPEVFVRRVITEGLGADRLLLGFDSALGHRRLGTFEYLERCQEALGIEVRQASVEELLGERVSSTLVREAVRAGDLSRLSGLLGRPFSLLGSVVKGAGRGRTLGVPTANLDVGGAAVVPVGVYFAVAELAPSQRQPAVVNIGRRPTFEAAGAPTVEVHVLDFDQDIYGERLEIHLLARHRNERKFPSPDALKQQILADIEALRRLDVSAAFKKAGGGSRGSDF